MNLQLIEQNGFHLIDRLADLPQTLVLRATQQTLARTVVIQVLKAPFASDAAVVAHFLKSARLFARIKSDSAASIFDIVSDGDLHYVVMECVEGPSLEEWVREQGPLPLDQALRIAASLVVGIDQIVSSNRVVLGLLSSLSVRLDSRGIAKLTDFALTTEMNTYGSEMTVLFGAPEFTAPEQTQRQPVTTQTDMYGLGALLYYLTTGKKPFDGEKPADIFSAHVERQIPPPHRIHGHLSVAFSELLYRLMMKEPSNRYADWDAVLLDIRHLLEGTFPDSAHPETGLISTIANDFDAQAANILDERPPAGEHIRVIRKGKSKKLAEYQDQRLAQSQASELSHANRSWQVWAWFFLLCWLGAIFWFRAVYQADPAHAQATGPLHFLSETANQFSDAMHTFNRPPTPARETDPDEPDAEQHPAESAPQPPPVQPPPSPDVAALPPAPQATLQQIAESLAHANLSAAKQTLYDTGEPFQGKTEMLDILNRMPAPEELVADYLRARIGQPVVFEHNGQRRTVIPESFGEGSVKVRVSGNLVEFSLAQLSPGEKLRWMDRSDDPARIATYALALLSAGRQDDARALAVRCPALSNVLAQAAALTQPNGATPTAPAQ